MKSTLLQVGDENIEYAVHFGGNEIASGLKTIARAKEHIKAITALGYYADAYVVRYTGINQVKSERI